MADSHDEIMARLLAEQGINLDDIDDDGEPFNLREPDPIGVRRRWVVEAFAARTRGAHKGARVTHPQVQQWVTDNLADPQNAATLLIMGPPGVGKTYEAIGALRAVANHHAEHNHTLDWRIIAHADLNAALRPKTDHSHEGLLERYAQVPYLLLDDLGAGYLTEYAREGALRLVDDRYRNGMSSIYTTNLDIEGLTKALGRRATSRLMENRRHVVVYDGPDRRLKKVGA